MIGRIRASLFVLLACGLAHAQAPPEPNRVLEATGAGLGRIEIELRAPGSKEPVRYELKGEGGTVVGGIALPKEGDVDYEITAYDVEGRLTHIGSGSIGAYQMDKGARLALDPIDGAEGIAVSVTRERLVLETIHESPERVTVRAHAFDPLGNRAYIKPGDLTWQLSDGRIIHLIPKFEDGPIVDVVPNKDYFELCPLQPVLVACKWGTECKVRSPCTDPFVRVSAGSAHTCGLTRAGVVLCWGDNLSGQLGAPTTTACANASGKCSTKPIPVVCPPDSPCQFTQIAAGVTLTTAVDINGDAWWWGRGGTTHHRVTASMFGNPVKFSLVTAGFGHGCAISQSQSELWCWGANAFGEAGPGSPAEVPHTAPVRVFVPGQFKRVSAGGEHTCAVTKAGTDVVCWGRNVSSAVTGFPASASRGFPDVTHGPFFFQQFGGLVAIHDVAASVSRSCANMNIGVRCWGSPPFMASSFGWPQKVTTGDNHICALSNQQASCLGGNAWGQLGIGTTSLQSSSVPVLAPPPLFDDLSAGDVHTCGVTPDGEIFCWGNNWSGQLGNGSFNVIANRVPVKVVR